MQKIKTVITQLSTMIGNERPSYTPGTSRSVFHPEPPLGFVSRRDPNFYFLRRG